MWASGFTPSSRSGSPGKPSSARLRSPRTFVGRGWVFFCPGRNIVAHIVNELQQNAKTDTIFVVAAVLFNLVVLGINWGVAHEASRGNNTGQNDFILGLLIFGTVLINIFATRALIAGRSSREMLLLGLKQMYEDNDVAKYYDDGLLGTYQARYTLFTLVLGVLGAIAIVVPLIARNMN